MVVSLIGKHQLLGETTEVVTMETLRVTTSSVMNNMPPGSASSSAYRSGLGATSPKPNLSQNAYSNLPAASSPTNLRDSTSSRSGKKARGLWPQSSFYDDVDEAEEGSWIRGVTAGKDANSFAESVVSKSWYLPSLTASTTGANPTVSMMGTSMVVSDSADQWAEAEESRRFLKSIFLSDGKDLTREEDDASQLTDPLFNEQENRRSTSQRRSLAATAPSSKKSRNLLLSPSISASTGNLLSLTSSEGKKPSSPQQERKSSPAPLPRVEKGATERSNAEKDFLFLNNLLAGDGKKDAPLPGALSSQGGSKNPLLKLNKLRQHFKESPMALRKQQQQLQQGEKNGKAKKKQSADTSASELVMEEDTPPPPAFFFASLLGKELSKSPNIGPTTYPLIIDKEELRALVLMPERKTNSKGD